MGADGSGAGTQAAVSNTGTINAGKGKVSMASGDFYALAMDLSGTIIGKNIDVRGGAGGVVAVNGTLDASSSTGKGGTIDLFGDRVGLFGNALVNANGANGGGNIRIGGDYLGSNAANAPQANRTVIGTDARVTANATQSGNGGRVIVWSNEYTGFFGSIQANGAGTGKGVGNGGFIETSSHDNLQSFGRVDAKAALGGKGGTWLMDPSNISIENNADANGAFDALSPNTFVPANDNAIADVNTINTSLTAGTNVIVNTAGGAGTQVGNITLINDILMNNAAPTSATLTLNALGSIILTNNITANALNDLSVVLNAVNGVTMNGNITTQGGSLTIANSGAFAVTQGGASTLVIGGTTSVTTGGAAITLVGTGNNNFTGAVSLTNTGAANNVQITDTNNLVLGVLSIGGNLTVFDTGTLNLGSGTVNGNLSATTTAGAITQTGALTIGGVTNIVTTNAAITLTQANDFGSVVNLANTGAFNVAITDTNTLLLGTVTMAAASAGALTITAVGLTQSGATIITSGTGAVTINGGAGVITLTNLNEFNGAVSLNNSGASAVAITDANALVLGTSSVGSGTLTVIATGANNITQTGAITQAAGAGATSFTTGAGLITLTQANDFTGAVSLTNTGAFNVAITDTNTLLLGTVSMAAASAGALTITAVGLTQSGATIITSGTGAVTINGGAGVITLTNLNEFNGAVSLNNSGASAVAITDANALVLGTSSVGSGTLTVIATGASNITQTGAITQAAGAGATSFTTGAGLITLTQANDFTGVVTLNNSGANDVAITDANALILGASTVGQNLSVIASALDVQAAINAGAGAGVVNITSNANVNVGLGTAAVGLNISSAEFGFITAATLNITAAGAGTMTVNGVTTGGTITGITTLTAGGTGVTFTGAGSTFNNGLTVASIAQIRAVGITTVNAAVTFSNDVTLATGTATITTAGGAINFLTNLDSAGAARSITLAAGAGTITLFDVGATTPLATLTVSSANDIVLSGSTVQASNVSITSNAGTAVSLGGFVAGLGLTDAELDLIISTGPLNITANGAAMTVDGVSGGGTITGITTLTAGSGVTFQTAASSFNNALTVASAATIAGVNLTTTGNMTFSLTTVLSTAAVSLNSNGGAILFSNTLNGGNRDLTIAAGTGAGTTIFTGTVANMGDGTGAAITLDSIGLVDFRSTVGGASGIVSSNAAGSTKFQQDVTLTAGDTASTFAGAVNFDGMNWSGFLGLTVGAATLSSGPVNVTSNGGLITFSSTLNGAQALTLTAAAGTVTFTGLVGNTGQLSSLTIASAGDVVIGAAMSVNGTVSITSNAATAVGLGSGAGALQLSDAELDFITSTGTLNITATGAAMTVEGVSGGGTITGITTLTAGGTGVTFQTADSSFNNALTVVSAATIADVTLTTSGDNVIFSNTVDLTTGAVGITTAGGDLTFNGALNGAQALTLTAGAGDIFFNSNVGNTADLGAVTIATADDVAIGLGAVVFEAASLAQTTGTGTTTFTAVTTTTGAPGVNVNNEIVTMNAGITTTGAGTVTLNATVGSLNIAPAGNINSDGAVTLTGATGISTSGDVITTNDNATFTATTGIVNFTAGTINLGATGDLSLVASGAGGGVTQAAGSTMLADALTITTGAANDASLIGTSNNFASVQVVSGRDITLNDVSGVDFAGTSTISRNLILTAAGDVTDSGTLAITGTTSITAGATHDITLDGLNNFGGSVTVLSADNATFNDTGAFDLAASTISGSLTLTAGGAVTDSGTSSIGATANVTARGFDVTLDNSSTFVGAITINSSGLTTGGGNITLVTGNAIQAGLDLDSAGAGNSGAGNGFDGGDISVSSGAIAIALAPGMSIVSDGGDKTLVAGNGGNGGNITFVSDASDTGATISAEGGLGFGGGVAGLDGTISFLGDYTLNGNATYNSSTSFNNILVTGLAGNILTVDGLLTVTGTVDGLGGFTLLTLVTQDLALSGAFTNLGSTGVAGLTIKNISASGDINGDYITIGGTGGIALSQAEWNLFGATVPYVVLGDATTNTGTITVAGAWTNNRKLDVDFLALGTGEFNINAAISGAGSLTVNGSGNTTHILTTNISQAAGITILDSIEVAADVVLESTAGNIVLDATTHVGDTIMSTGGSHSLTLRTTSAAATITVAGDFVANGTGDFVNNLSLAGSVANFTAATLEITGQISGRLEVLRSNTLSLDATFIADIVNLQSAATTLAASTTFTTASATGITFGGTLRATTAGVENLTLTAGAGNVTFSNTVGVGDALGDIIINSANNVTFGTNLATGTINADSLLQTTGTGTTTFFGTQNYATADGIDVSNRAISVERAITTTLGTVDLNATAGILSILANGDINSAGEVNLTGATRIETAGDVLTTGDNVTYHSATTLTGDVSVSTGLAVAGDINFDGTIDGSGAGGQDLALISGTGDIFFTGPVGSTRLGDISITLAHDVTASDSIRAGSFVQTDGTGTTTFVGTQNYGAVAGLGLRVKNDTIVVNNTITTTLLGVVTLNADTTTLTISDAGNIFSAGAVTLTGATGIFTGGDVTTTGVQNVTYIGDTTLTDGGISVTTGGGNIQFTNELEATTAGVDALTLTAGAGDIDFLDVVGATRLGAVIVNSGATVQASDTFTAASFTQVAGSVVTAFAGVVDLTGAFDFTGQALTMNGVGANIVGSTGGDMNVTNAGLFTTLNGANLDVGGSFIQDGTVGTGLNSIGGDIISAGDISFLRGVTLTNNAGIRMDTGGLLADSLVFSSTLDGTAAGAQALTMNAGLGSITFGDAVGGGIAAHRLGAMLIDDAGAVTAVAITAASFVQTTGTGTTIFNGIQNYNTATGLNVVNETIFVNQSITTTAGGIVTLNADTFALTIAALGDITSTGDVELTGNTGIFTAGNVTATSANVTFNSDTTITGVPAGITITTVAAGSIFFDGTIDAAGDGVQALTVDAATNATFSDNIGLSADLGFLDVTAAVAIFLDSAIVNTNNNGTHDGHQLYDGDVVLGNLDSGLFGFSILTSTGGGDITFTGDINSGTGAGAQGLRIRAADSAIFGDNVGSDNIGTLALGFLDVTADLNGGAVAGNIQLNSETVGTNNIFLSGNQTYNTAVLLGNLTTGGALNGSILTSTGGGDITFNSTIDANGSGTQGLAVNAAGNAIFGNNAGDDNIGGGAGQALGFLVVNAGVEIQLNSATVDTTNAGGATGTQTYDDAVVLGNTTNAVLALNGSVLTSTGAGNIVFNSTIDALALGTQTLTVDAADDAIFDGNIGAGVGTDLGALTVTAGGTINLNSAIVNTDDNVATGDQLFNSAVVLGNAVGSELTSNGGGDITFVSTIDALALGTQTLTVDAAGDAIFDGNIGDGTDLGALEVTAGGTINLNSAIVNTDDNVATGDQLFNSAVVLGNAVGSELTSNGGGDITFVSTIDAATLGTQTLTVDAAGDAIFGDNIGAGSVPLTFALGALTVTAGGTINLNSLIVETEIAAGTTGNQTYNSAVVLGNAIGSTLISTTGGTITFRDTVDAAAAGVQNLLVFTTGEVFFDDNVGLGAELGELTVTADVGINIGLLTPITIDTLASGIAATTGNQSYNSDVTVFQNAILTSSGGGDIFFDGSIDGAALGVNFTVFAADNAIFNGNIGAATQIGTFTVDCGNDFGETITFGALASSVRAENVRLNTNTLLPTPATVATIVASSNITFSNTTFAMGQNHKLTGLGNITIGGLAVADATSVTLGDVNAVGNLRVTSPIITLLARASGPILTNTGGTITDPMVDYVVGGRVFFSTAPVMGGSGGRATFSNPTGNVDGSGTLGNFAKTVYRTPITVALLTGITGQILDLSSASGVSYTNPATFIPQAMSSLPPVGLLGNSDTLDEDKDEATDGKSNDGGKSADSKAKKTASEEPKLPAAVPVASR